MGYYTIQELVSEEERIQCVFQTDATDCSFLDPSALGKDLAANTKLELPLWMAAALARHGTVKTLVPTCLNSRFRNVVKAGPSAANLRDMNQYYFEMGKKILPLIEDDEEGQAIDDILRVAFGGERYKAILDHSMNSHDEDTTEFTRKLTEFEKELFQAGLDDAEDFLSWKRRDNDLIKCAKVIHMKKRKREN
ncbi:hypothetical protein THRCLA_11585 [Thraustotheca clavata]|uniref:Uncharacterized protein n=1 Tax=Thraustotheca clavata TaxID=74557 RepID=A0A1V9Y7C4_9STRA|nr:hypothetical protein THRCLA_11585 [Thraustotheca clavata]